MSDKLQEALIKLRLGGYTAKRCEAKPRVAALRGYPASGVLTIATPKGLCRFQIKELRHTGSTLPLKLEVRFASDATPFGVALISTYSIPG
jgi:hypothetical protein